jgi:hypothetical protein
MEIIDFPGGKPKAVPTREHKFQLGPMRFTCDCGASTEISIKGALFRYIEFYCTNCGCPYKVTNPAFVRPVMKKPPKK